MSGLHSTIQNEDSYNHASTQRRGEGVFMIPLSVTLFVSEDWDDGDEGFTRVGMRIISGSYLMKNQASAF